MTLVDGAALVDHLREESVLRLVEEYDGVGPPEEAETGFNPVALLGGRTAPADLGPAVQSSPFVFGAVCYVAQFPVGVVAFLTRSPPLGLVGFTFALLTPLLLAVDMVRARSASG